MKKDIHPDYHPVIFQDMTTGHRYITRSTAKSDKTEEIDGVEHFVISMGLTADSHPFSRLTPDFIMDAIESQGYHCDARILELNSYFHNNCINYHIMSSYCKLTIQ